jgi:hypothetical protein
MCGDGLDVYPTLTYINNMIKFPLVLLYGPFILCHFKLHPQWTKGLHLPPNEQKFPISSLTLGKASSPNGVIVQIFLTYWPLIKAYYKKMVHTSIPHSKFPPWCHTYAHSIERGKDRYLGIVDLSPYSMSLINCMQKLYNLGSNRFCQKILVMIKLYFCLCNYSWNTFSSFVKH